MTHFKDEYILSRQEYGDLFPYISDDAVSGVFWNGRALWIDEISHASYPVKESISEDFIDKFVTMMCTRNGMKLGPSSPTATIRTPAMDMTIIHGSIATSGTGFIIKKKNPPKKPDTTAMIEAGICTNENIDHLRSLAESRKSVLITGAESINRTEILRLLAKYTESCQRTVVIEGKKPLNLSKLYPGKDITEFAFTKELDIESFLDIIFSVYPRLIILQEPKPELIKTLIKCVGDDISIFSSVSCELLSELGEFTRVSRTFDEVVELAEKDEKESASGYRIKKILNIKPDRGEH